MESRMNTMKEWEDLAELKVRELRVHQYVEACKASVVLPGASSFSEGADAISMSGLNSSSRSSNEAISSKSSATERAALLSHAARWTSMA
jgi:hypothetical protein